MKRIFGIILIYLFISSTISAQTFGFGCLGLSGFYGGYGIHTYDATGLNNAIALKYPGQQNITRPKFEQSTGFRFGANILRAEFASVFITAKGFYQFGREEKSLNIDENGSPSIQEDYELQSNHWGIAIDFGLPLFKFLQLKLVEGGVTFYNIEYKENIYQNDVLVSDESYQNDGFDLGYYVGTGLIIVLIKDYVSIEGSAMYHFYNVETIQNSDGQKFFTGEDNKPFIKSGKFAAAVQLNIGFPL